MATSREQQLLKYFHTKTGERINFVKAKWNVRDLLTTYEYSELVKLIDYYVRISPDPNWKYFVYNIEKIAHQYDSSMADRLTRQKLRNHTRKLVGENERRSGTD